jgi:hypothetical protein
LRRQAAEVIKRNLQDPGTHTVSTDDIEPPRVKPLIRWLSYSDDGILLVMVSAPSVLDDGKWTQPFVYDLFDKEGTFVRTLTLPDGFTLRGMRGGRIWGVLTDSNGEQTVGIFRLSPFASGGASNGLLISR